MHGKGGVAGKIILTDSTHVKVNASFKKNIKVLAGRETANCIEWLDFYEAEERAWLEATGAIKPKRTGRMIKEKAQTERTVSTTDFEAGMLRQLL